MATWKIPVPLLIVGIHVCINKCIIDCCLKPLLVIQGPTVLVILLVFNFPLLILSLFSNKLIILYWCHSCVIFLPEG